MQAMNETAIEKAVRLLGGQTETARRLGIKQQLVWYWVNKSGKCSPTHAVGIEKLTDGLVTRYDLRPDVFGQNPNN
jgi:DNA-binding transcriptional regulator YdaS (Cro superfamily)